MAKIGLAALLKAMVEQNASDLHITNGVPPQFRIHGKMIKVKIDPLSSSETKELCYSVLTDTQKAEFEKNLELDFSFGIKDVSRFRGNIFFQRGAVSAVFRRIPMQIPEFNSLRLPQILKKVIRRPNGLILVTGPTGSGKSTSLASMLDILNREEYGHILTVEDPIEFVHPHKNCIINQREVGVDTRSFGTALRRVLRQDPDFVLIGEMRDIETIETGLTLAETGHLVFGTLHTNGAVQSINRMINVFPPHHQPQIRQILSFSLQAIVSQQLLSRVGEPGRVIACEVLIPNPAIRNMIREDKIHQIYSAMQAGQGESGMQTMNQSLFQLIQQRLVSKQEAVENSIVPEELVNMIQTNLGDSDG